MKMRVRDGAPIYLNPDIENAKVVPKEAILLEGMGVYIFTIMGDYVQAVLHRNSAGEPYAEDEYHIWPIKYSEIEGCYVTYSMINKACIDKLKQDAVATKGPVGSNPTTSVGGNSGTFY
jgi:hypothetical protein